MKIKTFILLLLISIAAFAEDKIPESPTFMMPDTLPHSGLSSTIIKSYDGVRGYYKIAIGFAQIEDFKSALKYAKKVETQQNKDHCHFKIINEMLTFGLYDEALKTAKEINDESLSQQSYSEIIRNIINNNQDYEKAILYAIEYQDDNKRNLTKRWIIGDMLENNKIEDAKEFYAMNKSYNDNKSSMFDTIASKYLIQNDSEGLFGFMKNADIPLSDENIQTIVRTASRLNKTHLIIEIIAQLDDQEMDKNYAMIATSYIREYRYSEAYDILAKIQNVESIDQVYLQFARNYTQDRNMNKALMYADSISTIKARDQLFSSCSGSYTKFGYMDEAIALLQRVIDIRTKERMASEIAIGFYLNGEMKKHQEILSTISDIEMIDNLYYRLIQKLLWRKQYERIDECLENITENKVKDGALSKIIDTQIRSNDFENAIKLAKRIVDDDTRKRVFDKINRKK